MHPKITVVKTTNNNLNRESGNIYLIGIVIAIKKKQNLKQGSMISFM